MRAGQKRRICRRAQRHGPNSFPGRRRAHIPECTFARQTDAIQSACKSAGQRQGPSRSDLPPREPCHIRECGRSVSCSFATIVAGVIHRCVSTLLSRPPWQGVLATRRRAEIDNPGRLLGASDCISETSMIRRNREEIIGIVNQIGFSDQPKSTANSSWDSCKLQPINWRM